MCAEEVAVTALNALRDTMNTDKTAMDEAETASDTAAAAASQT